MDDVDVVNILIKRDFYILRSIANQKANIKNLRV